MAVAVGAVVVVVQQMRNSKYFDDTLNLYPLWRYRRLDLKVSPSLCL